MADVIDIQARRPHNTTHITCKECGHDWVAIYPADAQKLECPGCHSWLNHCGTRVFANTCATCGRAFTVCPPPKRPEDWQHCLARECASYDPHRDADRFFDLIEREPIAKADGETRDE